MGMREQTTYFTYSKDSANAMTGFLIDHAIMLSSHSLFLQDTGQTTSGLRTQNELIYIT